jgi:hypothetical protein
MFSKCWRQSFGRRGIAESRSRSSVCCANNYALLFLALAARPQRQRVGSGRSCEADASTKMDGLTKQMPLLAVSVLLKMNGSREQSPLLDGRFAVAPTALLRADAAVEGA